MQPIKNGDGWCGFGLLNLSGGLKLAYLTVRDRLVETILIDSETGFGPLDGVTYNKVWGSADIVLLDAPNEDACFDALVAEIIRVRQLLTLAAEPQPKKV